MNISEREIKSSCTKALRQLSISHEMNTFIDYVAKGQVANAETEIKTILEKSISKCIYQSLNDFRLDLVEQIIYWFALLSYSHQSS